MKRPTVLDERAIDGEVHIHQEGTCQESCV
jgi:hypothetical protein